MKPRIQGKKGSLGKEIPILRELQHYQWQRTSGGQYTLYLTWYSALLRRSMEETVSVSFGRECISSNTN
jgi:hypothetical protein